jgi:predicted nucleic acid-binding protein
MLVLDASTVFDALQFPNGFRIFREEELVAPPFMWSEVRSSLHETVYRGEMSSERGFASVQALDAAPVRPKNHRRLGEEAWKVADEMGWAKTYDAEYLALARLLGCRVVTVDERLWRGAARLGFVIGLAEL